MPKNSMIGIVFMQEIEAKQLLFSYLEIITGGKGKGHTVGKREH